MILFIHFRNTSSHLNSSDQFFSQPLSGFKFGKAAGYGAAGGAVAGAAKKGGLAGAAGAAGFKVGQIIPQISSGYICFDYSTKPLILP